MLHPQAPVAAAAEEPATEAATEAPAPAAEEPAAVAEETPAEAVKETETAAPEAPAEVAAEVAPAEASKDKVRFNSRSDMIGYLKALLICRRRRTRRPSSLVVSPLVSVISSRPSLRLRSPHPPRLMNILPRLTSPPLLLLLRTRPLKRLWPLRSPPPSPLLLSRKPRSKHLPPSL
jgi:hypothetical protein